MEGRSYQIGALLLKKYYFMVSQRYEMETRTNYNTAIDLSTSSKPRIVNAKTPQQIMSSCCDKVGLRSALAIGGIMHVKHEPNSSVSEQILITTYITTCSTFSSILSCSVLSTL
jgi:hypothetical protein